MTILGDLIYKYRSEARLTQAELSRIAKVDQATISKLESGYDVGIGMHRLLRITEALKVSAEVRDQMLEAAGYEPLVGPLKNPTLSMAPQVEDSNLVAILVERLRLIDKSNLDPSTKTEVLEQILRTVQWALLAHNVDVE